jgi:hypothetical protein
MSKQQDQSLISPQLLLICRELSNTGVAAVAVGGDRWEPAVLFIAPAREVIAANESPFWNPNIPA